MAASEENYPQYKVRGGSNVPKMKLKAATPKAKPKSAKKKPSKAKKENL